MGNLQYILSDRRFQSVVQSPDGSPVLLQSQYHRETQDPR